MEDVESLPRTKWNIQQPEGQSGNESTLQHFLSPFLATHKKQTILWPDIDSREEAIATGGLDLVLVPALGYDKVGRQRAFRCVKALSRRRDV